MILVARGRLEAEMFLRSISCRFNSGLRDAANSWSGGIGRRAASKGAVLHSKVIVRVDLPATFK